MCLLNHTLFLILFRRKPLLFFECFYKVASIVKSAVEEAKSLHPNALLLVHPESLPEVTAEADYAGSTTGRSV